MPRLNDFVMCRASPYVHWRDAYISGTEHNWKLKFSIQTRLTYINNIFGYYHANGNANDNALYLVYGNAYRPRPVLKITSKTGTMFFLKKTFPSFKKFLYMRHYLKK